MFSNQNSSRLISLIVFGFIYLTTSYYRHPVTTFSRFKPKNYGSISGNQLYSSRSLIDVENSIKKPTNSDNGLKVGVLLLNLGGPEVQEVCIFNFPFAIYLFVNFHILIGCRRFFV